MNGAQGRMSGAQVAMSGHTMNGTRYVLMNRELWAAGGGYAGDALEVVDDFNLLEAGGGE